MDSAKLLDVLTSLSVSHAILPRAVCFAASRPANHAICSFIDSSGYASGPIRRCLFIDYIIILYSTWVNGEASLKGICGSNSQNSYISSRGEKSYKETHACALVSLSDFPPPSVYKSHNSNRTINKLYI